MGVMNNINSQQCNVAHYMEFSNVFHAVMANNSTYISPRENNMLIANKV